MSDPSPLIAAGGSVGLFVVVAGLLTRLLIMQANRDRVRDDRIEMLEADNDWCNMRVSVLIRACQQGGITIPQEVWNGPPSLTWDRRRRARGRGGDHDDRPVRD